MGYVYSNGGNAKTFYKVFVAEYSAEHYHKPGNVHEIAAQCNELPFGGRARESEDVTLNGKYEVDLDDVTMDIMFDSTLFAGISTTNWAVRFVVSNFDTEEHSFSIGSHTDDTYEYIVTNGDSIVVIVAKNGSDMTSYQFPDALGATEFSAFQIGAIEEDMTVETTEGEVKYDTLGNKHKLSEMLNIEMYDLAATKDNYEELRALHVVNLYTLDYGSTVQHGSFCGNLIWNVYRTLSDNIKRSHIMVEKQKRDIDDIVSF